MNKIGLNNFGSGEMALSPSSIVIFGFYETFSFSKPKLKIFL